MKVKINTRKIHVKPFTVKVVSIDRPAEKIQPPVKAEPIKVGPQSKSEWRSFLKDLLDDQLPGWELNGLTLDKGSPTCSLERIAGPGKNSNASTVAHQIVVSLRQNMTKEEVSYKLTKIIDNIGILEHSGLKNIEFKQSIV